MMTEIINARIVYTMLGIEDHGILTANLRLEWQSNAQGFGGWAFDQYDETKKKRIGVAYGMEWIRRVLETLDVTSWEKVTGQFCRVKRVDGIVVGIGHIIEDKWFIPKEDLKDFVPSK